MAGVSEDVVFNFITNVAAFCEGMDRAIHGIDDLDKGMQKVEKNTSFLNRTLSVFSGIELAKLKDRLVGVVNKVKELGNRFVDFAKAATLDAARIEVQWRTLSMTGAKMGVTFDQIKESIGGLRAAGIKTSEALQVMTQWLSAGLPSEKLSELSRAAQDLAVVLGTDSTQAMERFNWFVQTGNSELLRTVGIMQTSTQMEERFAASIGKTREQLSDQERRLARVNGLLEATATYAGAYEEALTDPFKRMTSLAREFSNVVEAVGAIFVPLLGAAVDIASDALEKLERLFRVTKKEAKETGATIGEWKEGFLRLRAVVTAFANWFMSLWERLTSGFGDQAEGMMDRFVNAIIRGVQIAAEALRRFAQFMATLFGGTAPAAVTGAAPTTAAPPTAAPTPPPTTAPAQVMAAPEEAAKLRGKPVSPAAAEDVARYNELMAKLVDWNKKLAAATATVVKARRAFAKAEEALEKASEKVYNVRKKIERLERQWEEIPERFIRGRRRQLQAELDAAEEEERQRQKEAKRARERLSEAEAYQREVEKMTESLRREAERLGEAIAKQNEKYEEWLAKLQAAEQVSLVEPVQAVADEFRSLDDLTAGYLEEIEGQLAPAFASIEESVKSIGSSLGAAWDKIKGIAADVWDFLGRVKDWYTGLPDWAKKLLETGLLAIALNWVTGGAVGAALEAVLGAAFAAIGLGPTAWAIAAAGISISLLLVPALTPEVQEAWKKAWEIFKGGEDVAKAIGEAAGLTLENIPIIGQILKDWADQFRAAHPELIKTARDSLATPLIDALQDAYDALFGNSIVPEMVNEFISQIEGLVLDLTPHLDRLTAKFNVLSKAIQNIPIIPDDLVHFDAGQIKITTVNLQGSTFGAGITEQQIRDWIYDAIGALV